MGRYDDLVHMRILEKEIAVLKGKTQEHDTGHIFTAINVLENRIQEIERRIQERLQSYE